MSKQSISIAGKETKKHITEALKAVFPGMKFSFNSSYDSVTVRWTDGPMVSDVEKVLNRFQSYTRVLAHTDYKESTGYEWKGVIYVGPKFLSTVRQLSDSRKEAIVAYMEGNGGKAYQDANIPERKEAESALIKSEILKGVEPADRPDLMLDEPPIVDRRKPATAVKPEETRKVIPDNVVQLFPPKSAAQAFLDSLTPEQRLKLTVMHSLFQLEAADFLAKADMTVDRAFMMLAEQMYAK